MREIRLFVPQPLQSGELVELPPEVARHVRQVLRLREGAEVVLFDGRGGEFVAHVQTAGRTSVRARVGQHRAIERESPLGITLLPTGLVLLQPDLGTAIVYLFIFATIAFLAEVRLRYLAGAAVAGLASLPLFWHALKDYQRSRLLVFLNPNIDPLGAGYTIIQSKIAIGSGRFFGKGWMSGTQSQLNFLAERHTDFIFSVWGEEWGFLGSFFLVVMYAILIIMILRVATLSRDIFGRLLAAGVAALIFFHAFINIAMNIGMSPVVGLPLTFMSYGGSSLVINMAAIGIVLNIARQK